MQLLSATMLATIEQKLAAEIEQAVYGQKVTRAYVDILTDHWTAQIRESLRNFAFENDVFVPPVFQPAVIFRYHPDEDPWKIEATLDWWGWGAANGHQ